LCLYILFHSNGFTNQMKSRETEREKKKEASFHDVAGVAGFFLLLRFHFNIFPHRLSTPISPPFIFCIFSRRLCVCVCFSHSAGISEIPSELTVSATDDLTPLPPPPPPPSPSTPRHLPDSVPVTGAQSPSPGLSRLGRPAVTGPRPGSIATETSRTD